jgi:hypothetical protein
MTEILQEFEKHDTAWLFIKGYWPGASFVMENDSPLYGDHVSVSAVSSTVRCLSVQTVDHDQNGSADQNLMMCEGGLLEQGVYQCTYLWL